MPTSTTLPALRRRAFLCSTIAPMTLAAAGCSLPQPSAAAGRLLSIDVVDRDTGQVLDAYVHRGRTYVAGRPGARYAIRVTNRSGVRLLAVMSVDGVNVLNGRTAAWDQGGYVFEPWQTYEVTGWRKSDSQVAAFEFTSLPDSYAARTGRPLDVGVIGVAAFRERVRPAWREPNVLRYERGGEGLGDRSGERAGERERRAESPAAGQGAAQERDAPAPSAPSLAAPAPGAKAQAEAQARAADSASTGALARRSDKLGTGHGQREDSWVTTTTFERASSAPDEIVAIQYDRMENLVAAGVVPAAPVARPRPFPGSRDVAGYVPDPPRY